jgi:hypothetical protein
MSLSARHERVACKGLCNPGIGECVHKYKIRLNVFKRILDDRTDQWVLESQHEFARLGPCRN